jgi:hypothetical protein
MHLDCGEWVVCPHHSGFKLLKKVMASDLTDEEKAKRILRFYLRPSRFVHHQRLPGKNMAWTVSDVALGWVYLAEEALYWQKRRGKSPAKARSIAHARMHEFHPDFYDYAFVHKQVKLNDETLSKLRRNAHLELFRLGVEVDKTEALRAYNWLVGRGRNFVLPGGKNARTIPDRMTDIRVLQGKCPITLTAPQGKFAAKIIQQMAVTNHLWEALHADAWVRSGRVDEPAIEFNKRSPKERKYLLGCEKCSRCWQEDVFSKHQGDKGVYFTVNAEVLLTMTKTERVANIVTEQLAYGQPGISAEEEDLLRRSMFYLAPDVEELVLEEEAKPDYVSPEELEDDDEYALSIKTPSKLSVNQLAMKEDLRAYALNGPVHRYNMDDHDYYAWNRAAFFRWEKSLRERLALQQKYSTR